MQAKIYNLCGKIGRIFSHLENSLINAVICVQVWKLDKEKDVIFL